MFYFMLYDDLRLTKFSSGEKQMIISIAIKSSRKKFPINLGKRILALIVLVILPAVALFYITHAEWSLVWLLLSTLVINAKIAKSETPNVILYLDDAIVQFKNKI